MRATGLVTLHGFLGAPALWEPCFDRLSGLPLPVEHRWLPGHGPSPWTLPGASFERIVDAFAATIPAGTLLVGYSLGARLALSLLARHPGRFAAVLAFGGHPGLVDPRERDERIAADEAQACQIEREGLPAFVARWEQLPLFATQRALPPSVLDGQRAARRSHAPDAVAWALRSLGLGVMPPLWTHLAALSERLFLVTGERDEKFTTLAARTGVTHVTVAGSGHNVPMEDPEVSARLIEGWVRGDRGGLS